MEQEKVWFFDTTLRDGDQSPGINFTVEEKIAIARQLEKVGVDVIEAGFAQSSDGILQGVQAVASAVTRPVVLSLARTKQMDIEKALRAVSKAQRPGIHIFIATSDLHLEHKLRMTREQVLEEAAWATQFCRKFVDHVEFSAEDASRSDVDFLAQVYTAVAEHGATVLNVPDTTGYATPQVFYELVHKLVSDVLVPAGVRWSVHCHNDLGMAVANSYMAVLAGARQVECTVNGIGERAGNTSFAEVVMALYTHPGKVVMGIDTKQLFDTAKLVSRMTGWPIPANQPVVGDNAFAHESGIHQHGVINNPLTYEIMRPEVVGRSGNKLVIGKQSGRAAFVNELRNLGVDIESIDVSIAFARFKELADRKRVMYSDDLLSIVGENQVVRQWMELVDFKASTSDTLSAVSITVLIDGSTRHAVGSGVGLVDASFNALLALTGVSAKLIRYNVSSLTAGSDAQGEGYCVLETESGIVAGHGTDINTVQAGVKAMIDALNKLVHREGN